MKISKKDILAASGCALLLPGGLGLSYFVFGYGLKGCVLAVFLSLFAAVSVLAAYIWQSKKVRRENNDFRRETKSFF